MTNQPDRHLELEVAEPTSPRRGRKNCSPGRKPWDTGPLPQLSSPVGAKLSLMLVLFTLLVAGCRKAESDSRNHESVSKQKSTVTKKSVPERKEDAQTKPVERAFKTPWHHKQVLELAGIFRSRGFDSEKAYAAIPKDRMERLTREYEQHRGDSEKPFSELSKNEVASLYLAVVIFWDAEEWKQEDVPWVACPLYEFEDGMKVAIHFRHAHPFLAEFFRKLIVTVPGKDTVEINLPVNVGGRTDIKVSGILGGDKRMLTFKARCMHKAFDFSVYPPDRIAPSDAPLLGRIGANQKFIPVSGDPSPLPQTAPAARRLKGTPVH